MRNTELSARGSGIENPVDPTKISREYQVPIIPERAPYFPSNREAVCAGK